MLVATFWAAKESQMRQRSNVSAVDIRTKLAKHLVRKGSSAMEPLDFVALIERWLTDVLVRPFEVKRYAILLDQVRDWSLGFVLRSWWEVVSSKTILRLMIVDYVTVWDECWPQTAKLELRIE